MDYVAEKVQAGWEWGETAMTTGVESRQKGERERHAKTPMQHRDTELGNTTNDWEGHGKRTV